MSQVRHPRREQEEVEAEQSGEKRKRQSPQKPRTTRAPAVRDDDDSESVSEIAVSKRASVLSQKDRRMVGDDRVSENKDDSQDTPRVFSIEDVMAFLLRTQKENQKEKREDQEKEKTY